MQDEVAFLKNFGWAPQRYQSRARPYGRECRRWNSIWSSTATEAASASPERKRLAIRFLTELGGENSARLLLGALLADLAVEHYDWASGGDKANSDTSTTMARFQSFLQRLGVLFLDCMILRLPDT